MKTLLLFSLTLLLLVAPLAAQDWEVVKEGDTPVYFDLSTFVNNSFFLDANTGWVVCNDGVVLKTTDGGINWTTTQIPDALGIDLEDVEFADANTGYACSDDGFIYKTTDGGTNWTMIGDTANYAVDIAGLSVVDADLVYFCGDDSTLLKTEDGGTSYSNMTYGFQGEDLDGGIHFISPTVGVVISDANSGHTWYTHDGGQNWEYVQMQFPPGTVSQRLYEVSGSSDGTFAIAAYHRVTFLSADSGQTYQASGDVEYGFERFTSVQVLDANTIISSGSDGMMVMTNDAGVSWDTLYTGSGQTGICHHFINSSTGYFFQNYGQWAKTTNGGATWNPLLSWPAISFWGLSLASDTDIFISGYGGGELTESQDGGETWTYPDNYKTMTPNNLYECEFIDASNGIVAGSYGTMRRTTDGGVTWAFVDNPMYQQTNKHINSLRYMNQDTVFAGGSSGIIMRSEDGGETWTELENDGTSTTYDIWPVNDNLIIASASSGKIYLSNATLDTFHMVNDYGSMSMRAVEFRGDVGIVPASSGHIYRTTLADIDTLYEVFLDGDGDDMYDVEFVTDSIAYVVGENGKIYKTVDTGLNWTAETSPVEETLQKVAYRNHIVWAVGQYATILKLDLTDAMSIETAEWQVVGAYHLAQNYPNPFNPTTTINFMLKKAGPVKLQIYNIRGQKVTTLVDQEMKAGSHSVNWNAAELASGVYFYKLNSGAFTDVKKMMLIK